MSGRGARRSAYEPRSAAPLVLLAVLVVLALLVFNYLDGGQACKVHRRTQRHMRRRQERSAVRSRVYPVADSYEAPKPPVNPGSQVDTRLSVASFSPRPRVSATAQTSRVVSAPKTKVKDSLTTGLLGTIPEHPDSASRTPLGASLGTASVTAVSLGTVGPTTVSGQTSLPRGPMGLQGTQIASGPCFGASGARAPLSQRNRGPMVTPLPVMRTIPRMPRVTTVSTVSTVPTVPTVPAAPAMPTMPTVPTVATVSTVPTVPTDRSRSVMPIRIGTGPTGRGASMGPHVSLLNTLARAVTAHGPVQRTNIAILVGSNYEDEAGLTLGGCVNDMEAWSTYITRHRPQTQQVKLLEHSGQSGAGKPAILAALQQALANQAAYRLITFVYPGHGVQLDQQHEAMAVAGPDRRIQMISDTELHHLLVPAVPRPIGPVVGAALDLARPTGSDIVFIADCCHSGSLVDLPYHWTPVLPDTLDTAASLSEALAAGSLVMDAAGSPFYGEEKRAVPGVRGVRDSPRPLAGSSSASGSGAQTTLVSKARATLVHLRKVLTLATVSAKHVVARDAQTVDLSADMPDRPQAVVVWSATREDQTDADASLPGGLIRGALSWCMGEVWSELGPRCSTRDMLIGTAFLMRGLGFAQCPQLESSVLLDMAAPCTVC